MEREGVSKMTELSPTAQANPKDGELNSAHFVKEWTLVTDGSALLDVMNVEGVDHVRTNSNHITQIYEVSWPAPRIVCECALHQEHEMAPITSHCVLHCVF